VKATVPTALILLKMYDRQLKSLKYCSETLITSVRMKRLSLLYSFLRI